MAKVGCQPRSASLQGAQRRGNPAFSLQRLRSGQTGLPRLARKDEKGYRRRISMDSAWASRPSRWARASAAGAMAARLFASHEISEVRFMKSSTDRPEAKRAVREVGSTWLGP